MNVSSLKQFVLICLLLILCQCKKKDSVVEPQSCKLKTYTNDICTITMEYNAQGQIVSYASVYKNDFNGITGNATIEYNSNGKPIKLVSDNNPNSLPNGAGVSDAITTREYDESGRIIKTLTINSSDNLNLKYSMVYEYGNDNEFYTTKYTWLDELTRDTVKMKYVYSNDRKKLSVYSQPLLSSSFDGKTLATSRNEYMIYEEVNFTDTEVINTSFFTDQTFMNNQYTINDLKIYAYSYDDNSNQVVRELYYETTCTYDFDTKGNMIKWNATTNYNQTSFPNTPPYTYSEEYTYTCQ